MPDKKNIIISTLIFVLIVLFFPLKTTSNLKYKLNKVVKLSNVIQDIEPGSIPYVYGAQAGYFTPDLSQAWAMDINDGVVLLDNGYINYKRDSGYLNLIDLSGELKYSIQSNGYPFSINGRLFIIERDRKTLSEYNDGVLIWSKTFNHIITVIDSNSEFTALGFVNGNFVVLDTNGDIFYEYEPGGSTISIIYGIEISNDGKYIALISGLSPQRFTLYERRNLEFKPIFTENMKNEMRRAVELFITSNNSSVFIEGIDGYIKVDIDKKSSRFIPSNYSLKNVRYMPEVDLYMLHTGAKNINEIKFVSSDYRELLSKEFSGNNVSVTTKGKSVYIVINDSISKLDIEER